MKVVYSKKSIISILAVIIVLTVALTVFVTAVDYDKPTVMAMRGSVMVYKVGGSNPVSIVLSHRDDFEQA